MNLTKRFQMLDFLPPVLKVEKEINPKRILTLKEGKGRGVIYLITREFRFFDNFALDFATKNANGVKPLIVMLMPKFESISKAIFFKENLNRTVKDFQNAGFEPFICTRKMLFEKLHTEEFGLLIKDFNPILNLSLPFGNYKAVEIDGHNIIPSFNLSEKQECCARTFRKQVYLNIGEFLSNFKKNNPYAEEILSDFINNKLPYYAEFKNNPVLKLTSNLSQYLNWGFISSQRVVLEVLKSNASRINKEAFLEEIIVRKELSDNFCLYCKNYKNLKCVPSWAYETLIKHKSDFRKYVYNKEDFENAKTHSALWNACQKQLIAEGKIEGYLRMYWAKKILLWSENPNIALDIAIYLNDKYGFDAPSASGYTGILWSIAGVHDRAFKEREIMGKIRPMTYKGIKSKFDIQKYINFYNPVEPKPPMPL